MMQEFINFYDGFLISPVRNLTPETKSKIDKYVKDFEVDGRKMYVPYRDTNQDDDIGFRICEDNLAAMEMADEVYIWWDKNSKGSLFDLGMAFVLAKNLNIVNPEDIEPNDYKSFENLVAYWSMQELYS
jgi:hypothetical protein